MIKIYVINEGEWVEELKYYLELRTDSKIKFFVKDNTLPDNENLELAYLKMANSDVIVAKIYKLDNESCYEIGMAKSIGRLKSGNGTLIGFGTSDNLPNLIKESFLHIDNSIIDVADYISNNLI